MENREFSQRYISGIAVDMCVLLKMRGAVIDEEEVADVTSGNLIAHNLCKNWYHPVDNNAGKFYCLYCL